VDVYEAIGVKPIINASGSVTRLGGAPMPSEVLRAFAEAAAEAVPIELLQGAASRVIAEVTGAEAGLVTAGAAAALTLGTAGVLTGFDAGRMERLPHCDGFAHEFVVAREQRNGYDHAVRAAGARLVEVGFNELVSNAGVRRTEAGEYEAAFCPQTAGVLYVQAPDSRPRLQEVVAVAHRHGLPVLVDAAGELPPRRNLRDLVATGADLVAFSGGKAIRGPQASGILCGRRDLVGAAALQMFDMDDHPQLWQPPPELIDRERVVNMPRHGIGRGFKVSKEQIVALLTALRLFASGAYDSVVAGYRPRLERLAEALRGLPACCSIQDRGDAETFPVLVVAVDEAGLGQSAMEVCRRLRSGNPPIYVGHARLAKGRLIINPLHLDDAKVEILARRLREELTK
jgi:L-seryl-tRNA(Ser) seleniumtransferase